MELDVLSPQMRMRPVSNKRARSPSSPSPLERASKRPLIKTHDSVSQLSCNSALASGFGTGLRRSWHEDEWVHQTRGLTIHSPALENEESIRCVGGGALGNGVREDVQMNGLEENLRPGLPPQTQQAHNTLSVPPDIEISAMVTYTPPRYPQHRQCQTHLPLPLEAQGLTQPFLQPPPHSATQHIVLHPPTPSVPSGGPRCTPYLLSSPTPSSTPSLPSFGHVPSSPMSMTVETLPSSPSSSGWRNGGKKRHLVSMGPRVDCEKCRLKTRNSHIAF